MVFDFSFALLRAASLAAETTFDVGSSKAAAIAAAPLATLPGAPLSPEPPSSEAGGRTTGKGFAKAPRALDRCDRALNETIYFQQSPLWSPWWLQRRRVLPRTAGMRTSGSACLSFGVYANDVRLCEGWSWRCRPVGHAFG